MPTQSHAHAQGRARHRGEIIIHTDKTSSICSDPVRSKHLQPFAGHRAQTGFKTPHKCSRALIPKSNQAGKRYCAKSRYPARYPDHLPQKRSMPNANTGSNISFETTRARAFWFTPVYTPQAKNIRQNTRDTKDCFCAQLATRGGNGRRITFVHDKPFLWQQEKTKKQHSILTYSNILNKLDHSFK